MPYSDQDKFLLASDCKLEPPLQYPGKFHRNNKSGTLQTRSEWLISQSQKWVNCMKQSDKYERSPFSVKANCLMFWLKNIQVYVNKEGKRNVGQS